MISCINCKDISENILQKIIDFNIRFQLSPSLAIVLIGSDPASLIYVNRKIKIAERLNIKAKLYRYDENIEEEKLIEILHKLSEDNSINGIILQLPLPIHLNSFKLLNKINFKKDIDGLNLYNIGLLHVMKNENLLNIDAFLNIKENEIFNLKFIKDFFIFNGFIPCTALGSWYVLQQVTNLTSKHAIIFGHSNLVTKPMERLLLLNGCTTTVIHSKSKNYKNTLNKADIIIAATGGKRIIKSNELKSNAIVIDISIFLNDKKKISGDFLINSDLKLKNIKYTSVPNGIGPITVAFLMFNLTIATFLQQKLKIS